MKKNLRPGLMAVLLVAAAATVCLPASAMTRSQYIHGWTSACTSGGRSSAVPLTTSERMTLSTVLPSLIEGYARGMSMAGGSTTSLSALKKRVCSCMASRLAAKKHDYSRPNSDDAVLSAAERCL